MGFPPGLSELLKASDKKFVAGTFGGTIVPSQGSEKIQFGKWHLCFPLLIFSQPVFHLIFTPPLPF